MICIYNAACKGEVMKHFLIAVSVALLGLMPACSFQSERVANGDADDDDGISQLIALTGLEAERI